MKKWWFWHFPAPMTHYKSVSGGVKSASKSTPFLPTLRAEKVQKSHFFSVFIEKSMKSDEIVILGGSPPQIGQSGGVRWSFSSFFSVVWSSPGMKIVDFDPLGTWRGRRSPKHQENRDLTPWEDLPEVDFTHGSYQGSLTPIGGCCPWLSALLATRRSHPKPKRLFHLVIPTPAKRRCLIECPMTKVQKTYSSIKVSCIYTVNFTLSAINSLDLSSSMNSLNIIGTLQYQYLTHRVTSGISSYRCRCRCFLRTTRSRSLPAGAPVRGTFLSQSYKQL